MEEANTGKRNTCKAAIVCACAIVLAIGSVLAYLTATDTKVNNLSLATGIEIEVVEPGWVEADAQGMLPSQEVAKDPAIHNKSDIPIWVFADVTIPQKDIVCEGVDGAELPRALTDLFSYDANDGWTLKDTIRGDGSVTYRYAYAERLAGDGTTCPVFDKVRVCNYVGGQIDTASAAQQIIVNGVGVQASAFESVDEAYASYYGEPSIPDAVTVGELVVNDNSIFSGTVYDVVSIGTQSKAASSPATINTQVRFSGIELSGGSAFAVVPQGGDVEGDAVASFTVDKAFVERANSGRPVTINLEAFAVYSEQDKSLSFYKRESLPSIGDVFEGKTVTEVYQEVENLPVVGQSMRPQAGWEPIKASIERICVADDGIRPYQGTAYWFYAFPNLVQASNIGKLDLSESTFIGHMFEECTRLKTVDLDGLDTSNIENMAGMFGFCSALTEIDLSSFETARVKTMSGMFNGCRGLTTVYASSSFSTASCIPSSGGKDMFKSCSDKLVGGMGTKWSSSNIDSTYAHIDGGTSNPGYFTAKAA